jgi:hypothetical protein
MMLKKIDSQASSTREPKMVEPLSHIDRSAEDAAVSTTSPKAAATEIRILCYSIAQKPSFIAFRSCTELS